MKMIDNKIPEYISRLFKVLTCLSMIILVLYIISINERLDKIEANSFKECLPIKEYNDSSFLYSNFTKENLFLALDYYNIKYPEVVYAQAVLETGYFKSKLFRDNNNLFGLYDSKNKKFYNFKHWSNSVKAYAKWVQYRYKEDEDYYQFLSRIGYAEDPKYISKLKTIVKRLGYEN